MHHRHVMFICTSRTVPTFSNFYLPLTYPFPLPLNYISYIIFTQVPLRHHMLQQNLVSISSFICIGFRNDWYISYCIYVIASCLLPNYFTLNIHLNTCTTIQFQYHAIKTRPSLHSTALLHFLLCLSHIRVSL